MADYSQFRVAYYEKSVKTSRKQSSCPKIFLVHTFQFVFLVIFKIGGASTRTYQFLESQEVQGHLSGVGILFRKYPLPQVWGFFQRKLRWFLAIVSFLTLQCMGGGGFHPPSRFFPNNFFSGSPLALIFADNSQNFLRELLVKKLFRLHRYFFRYRAFVEGCRKVQKLACLKPWITKLVIFSVLLHKMN